MKIKFLSLLLVICLTVGFIPAVGSAETTATEEPTAAATTAPTTSPTTKPATAAPTTKPATTPSTSAPTTKATTPTTAPTTVPTTAPTTAPTGVADPTAISVSVKLCETSTPQSYLAVLTAAKGGKPVYATTNSSGTPTLVTNGSTPSNNYVKFEYPQNGLPTITLMNAKLRSAGNVLDLSSFDAPVKIVIAGNSTIESTGKCGIFRASFGDITIVGPKKLTMNCYSSAIAFNVGSYTNSLTLKELTLRATTSANADSYALLIPAGNLTVDRCNADIVNRAGVAVYLGKGNVNGQGNATIAHSVFSATSKSTAFYLDGNLAIASSNVQFSSDFQAARCTGNLTLNNSTLAMTGHSNTIETVNVGGDFILHASNAEIIGTKYVAFSDTTLPRTLGEYTVVAGITRDSTAPYNEALLNAYQYYYAESLEQPIEPTTPTGTDPTGTDPTGTDPTGTAPTGTETDPTGTDPAESFTDPTLFPPLVPTGDPVAPPEITTTTAPVPTAPASNASGGNSSLFWILAVLMILGACGAVAVAILMFRKNANKESDEESELVFDEYPQDDLDKKLQEHLDEEPQESLDEVPQEDITE